MITIDGETFDVGIINITRKPKISRKSLGTTQDGIEHTTTIGTYYNYEVTFATRKMNVAEYDRLFQLITTPVDYLECTFPYGQTTLTGNYEIESGSDKMVFDYTNKRRWSELKVSFNALEPARLNND